MNTDKLQVRYTGTSAEQYDAERRESPRFRAEETAFSKYFAKVRPHSAIDCPFGTGRWLDYYRSVKGPIIAVDLSDDMLAMAKSKTQGDANLDISYITGSAFDYDFSQFANKEFDLLVCTRFLNWITAADAQRAVANLSTSGTQWAIIGASVRPSEFSAFRRFKMKARLHLDNRSRQARQVALEHVHDEELLLTAFDKNGWQVEDKTHIFSSPTRENFFWLLKRKSVA